ncbi:hypothetical protein A9Q91_00850 [Candidatus Gracilibacteria bacterium 28_42_T64]|nr:hypothetical protein A9Q91_00850 [Candidatus Gracilibacteria bacterium 28_42_T64]
MRGNNNTGNRKGFSVIISLLIIGFLLVLTTGIYNLILRELYDNRDMGNAIKAYAGAEAAQELALLKIKEKGYGYSYNIDNSFILGDRIALSYDLATKVNNYEGLISGLSYDIVPLFYIDESGEQKVSSINLDVTYGIPDDLVWNLVSDSGGISGIGNDSLGFKKTLGSEEQLGLEYQGINSFLNENETVYMILFNSSNGEIKYTLESDDYFSKPRTRVISSATVGGVKQNLGTTFDNTEYLNILKYSIYSH